MAQPAKLEDLKEAVRIGLLRIDIESGSIMTSRPASGYRNRKGNNWRPVGVEEVPRNRPITRGYLRFGFSIDGIRYRCLMHRAIWMWANCRDIPEGFVIDHIDDDKMNSRIDNLDLVTHQENARRARAAGLYDNVQVDPRVYCRKLDETKVREIRSLAGSVSQAEIARRYGVSKSHVSRVIRADRGHFAWVK